MEVGLHTEGRKLDMANKRLHALEKRRAKYGFYFCLPLIIGFIIFILFPLIQSVAFAFSKVNITIDGFECEFKGLTYFKYILFEDAAYIARIDKAIGDFLYSLPFIVIFSLIIAIILNQQFKGRLIFRSIFFIPVIISTGIIMNFIMNDTQAVSMMDTTDKVSAFMSGFIDFKEVLSGMGLPEDVTVLLLNYIDQIFNLLWTCGIQILLFVSGLQSVPQQLYEVSEVEGATAWETFWYVTFPMLGNTLILVIVFTSIDVLTSTNNDVMNSAFTLMQQQVYDVSSAILWIYFAAVAGIIGILFVVLQHYLLRKWE